MRPQNPHKRMMMMENKLTNCLGVPMLAGHYYLCNMPHHLVYIHRAGTRQRMCLSPRHTIMVSLVECSSDPDGTVYAFRKAAATWYGDDIDDLSFPWTVWGEVSAVLQSH